MNHYFSHQLVNRQRLIWTVATRVQLERWEPHVANFVRAGFAHGARKIADVEIWAAATEHHFALVAAGHLLTAPKLEQPSSVPLDPTMRAELKEGRDLHEHWLDNMEVFNVLPRPRQPPRRSGKQYAERNPATGPYNWLAWNSKTGARLLPHVSAPALHRLLDAVEAEVLAIDSTLIRFVPPREPSPWIYEDGEWWPRPDEASI